MPKPVVNQRFDNAFDFAVAQLRFRLTFKLRIRQFDADDRDQTFANIVAGKVLFHFFEQIVRDGVVIQCSRQRGLEADHVRAAFVGVDVVGEGEDLLLVAVVVLHRDLQDRCLRARLESK